MQYNYYANDDDDKLQKFYNENFLNLQVNWLNLWILCIIDCKVGIKE